MSIRSRTPCLCHAIVDLTSKCNLHADVDENEHGHEVEGLALEHFAVLIPAAFLRLFTSWVLAALRKGRWNT